jgi:hypothetical protein
MSTVRSTGLALKLPLGGWLLLCSTPCI